MIMKISIVVGEDRHTVKHINLGVIVFFFNLSLFYYTNHNNINGQKIKYIKELRSLDQVESATSLIDPLIIILCISFQTNVQDKRNNSKK